MLSTAKIWGKWLYCLYHLYRCPRLLEADIKSGSLTPAASGAEIRAKWPHKPCLLGGPYYSAESKSQVAKIWGRWLHNPCLFMRP